MAPVRNYSNWNSRPSDENIQVEPFIKYFFICEGANTETWYFKKLIDMRKFFTMYKNKLGSIIYGTDYAYYALYSS